MDAGVKKCKGCGIVVDVVKNIDTCAKKILYCEFCLAQKNPRSKTEQKIKKRYTTITALSAFIVLIILIAVNWGKTKNENFYDYLVGYGLGYLIIWVFTAILLLPVLMLMKSPHREQIKIEKEKYKEEMEEKRAYRKSLQAPQAKVKNEK